MLVSAFNNQKIDYKLADVSSSLYAYIPSVY